MLACSTAAYSEDEYYNYRIILDNTNGAETYLDLDGGKHKAIDKHDHHTTGYTEAIFREGKKGSGDWDDMNDCKVEETTKQVNSLTTPSKETYNYKVTIPANETCQINLRTAHEGKHDNLEVKIVIDGRGITYYSKEIHDANLYFDKDNDRGKIVEWTPEVESCKTDVRQRECRLRTGSLSRLTIKI